MCKNMENKRFVGSEQVKTEDDGDTPLELYKDEATFI